MAEKMKDLEVQKEEVASPEGTERTRECRCFVPRADIYESGDQIVIVADVPGADESTIDIMLEKDVLTINALVNPEAMVGYTPALMEYEEGDYQRRFRISDEVDRDKIEASIKDGVLRLFLPKSTAARTRKIDVKAG